MNRETYLDKGVIKLSKLFKKAGYDLPPVHVSCSWPGGAGKDLKAKLIVIAKALGKYPHSKLTIPKKASKSNGGPTKITCGECGCTFRMSPKWAEQLTCCPVCESNNVEIG